MLCFKHRFHVQKALFQDRRKFDFPDNRNRDPDKLAIQLFSQRVMNWSQTSVRGMLYLVEKVCDFWQIILVPIWDKLSGRNCFSHYHHPKSKGPIYSVTSVIWFSSASHAALIWWWFAILESWLALHSASTPSIRFKSSTLAFFTQPLTPTSTGRTRPIRLWSASTSDMQRS